MNKRRGLGRGLEALIPSADYADELGVSGGRLRATLRLPIDEVRPNPEQPRRNFSPDQRSGWPSCRCHLSAPLSSFIFC